VRGRVPDEAVHWKFVLPGCVMVYLRTGITCAKRRFARHRLQVVGQTLIVDSSGSVRTSGYMTETDAVVASSYCGKTQRGKYSDIPYVNEH
jgi:hypothetical protein